MFIFKKEQTIFDIGGISIGGQPGENPTVLVGGLFFAGQPIVKSTKEGLFDKELAKTWIDTGSTMVEKTGHPLIIQVYGRTPVAMERHISWLVEHFDGPFMIESINARARMHAIQFCENHGLKHRAIFNSINLSTTSEEKELLKACSFEMAVVLGWSPRATSLMDRMDTIQKMISEAQNIGIDKLLVDPASLPVGAGYGLEYRTTLAVKSELGLPTCLGPHNAPSAWRFLRQSGFDNDSVHLSAVVAATIAAQLFATDVIMYGSMIRTKEVFTAVALISNAIATAAAEAQSVLGLKRTLFEPPTAD